MVVFLVCLIVVEWYSLSLTKIQISIIGFVLLVNSYAWMGFAEMEKNGILASIYLLWIGYRAMNSRVFKYLTFGVLCITSLYLNGAVNKVFKFDHERWFWIDGKYDRIIQQIQIDSTQIPYRLRPVVYNSGVIAINVIGRAVENLSMDRIGQVLGLLFTGMAAVGTVKSKNWLMLTILFLATCITVLVRNPDTTTFYKMMSPILLSAAIKAL